MLNTLCPVFNMLFLYCSFFIYMAGTHNVLSARCHTNMKSLSSVLKIDSSGDNSVLITTWFLCNPCIAETVLIFLCILLPFRNFVTSCRQKSIPEIFFIIPNRSFFVQKHVLFSPLNQILLSTILNKIPYKMWLMGLIYVYAKFLWPFSFLRQISLVKCRQ